jgi:endo-1,4-beta-xylanase
MMTHATTRIAACFAALVIAAAAAATAAEKGKGDAKMELTGEKVEARIAAHRTAEITLTVTDAAGKAMAGREVTVGQTGHKFLFGCNAFGVDPNNDTAGQVAYRKRFAELLNYATLPFYWGGYEKQPGRTQARKLRGMAQWCRESGIRPKGHPLCWQMVFPKWGWDKPLDELWQLQLHRIDREVAGFAGLIDTWDVVNEAVVMPDFQDNGKTNPISQLCRKMSRVEIIKQTFAAAVKANPKATLLLNDFDTSAKYADLIDQCLKAGVRIDVLGIQSHMHGGYRGAAWAWETCEQFARFGRPLHFTELTICSGAEKKDVRWQGPNYDDWASTPEGEDRQAKQAEEFYTVLFSHPAVAGITWWDFSDDRAWLGAPSGLVRKDMSPKPAYDRLMKLVKGKWWTGEQKLTTDAGGRVTFRGYLGTYRAEAGGAGGNFAVDQAGKAEVGVTVTATAGETKSNGRAGER